MSWHCSNDSLNWIVSLGKYNENIRNRDPTIWPSQRKDRKRLLSSEHKKTLFADARFVCPFACTIACEFQVKTYLIAYHELSKQRHITNWAHVKQKQQLTASLGIMIYHDYCLRVFWNLFVSFCVFIYFLFATPPCGGPMGKQANPSIKHTKAHTKVTRGWVGSEFGSGMSVNCTLKLKLKTNTESLKSIFTSQTQEKCTRILSYDLCPASQIGKK